MKILESQESVLFEYATQLGFDPKKLDGYQFLSDDSAIPFSLKQEYARADILFPEPSSSDRQSVNQAQSSSEIAEKIDPSLLKPPKGFFFEELVTEPIDAQRLAQVTTRCSEDPLVQQYQSQEKPDIDPELYPSSFLNVIPQSLVKALYYAP
jgi:hypothetical protein